MEEVTQLVLRERQCRDRGWWEEMADCFAGYRPSYRCLAWYLGQRGLQLRPHLLGDDQPEAVARQYQSDTAWLNEPR